MYGLSCIELALGRARKSKLAYISFIIQQSTAEDFPTIFQSAFSVFQKKQNFNGILFLVIKIPTAIVLTAHTA